MLADRRKFDLLRTQFLEQASFHASSVDRFLRETTLLDQAILTPKTFSGVPPAHAFDYAVCDALVGGCVVLMHDASSVLLKCHDSYP